jgi:hypothetical protein
MDNKKYFIAGDQCNNYQNFSKLSSFANNYIDINRMRLSIHIAILNFVNFVKVPLILNSFYLLINNNKKIAFITLICCNNKNFKNYYISKLRRIYISLILLKLNKIIHFIIIEANGIRFIILLSIITCFICYNSLKIDL